MTTENPGAESPPDRSHGGALMAGAREKIAYVSPDVFGNYESYTVSVGGGGKTRVTNNDASDSGPSWRSRS